MVTSRSDMVCSLLSFAADLSAEYSSEEAMFCDIQSRTWAAGTGAAGMSGSEFAKNVAAWLKEVPSEN
jgi:hypothetical protein